MSLPPAIQQFGINATDYLAGIDEMLSATDKLAKQFDVVIAAADRMSASLAEAAGKADESFAAASGAADRMGASLEEAAAGADESLAAVASAADESAAAVARAGESYTAAAGALDETVAAAERATTSQVTLSDAEKAAADAASFEAGLLADLDRSQALLADSAKAVTDGLAAEARAMGIVADEAALAGDATAAAGDKAVLAGDEAAASGEKAAAFGGMWKTALLGVGLAAVYGVDKAGEFQSSMEQLHTQAGVAQSQIAGLSQGVLQLAGQVGEGPQSLSESLYHVASNMASTGASAAQMLNAVKVAAEGAQVGNANLTDVTNALGAAIASGIPGVQNYTQAMGYMNATVGAGDMNMQDLSDAFGTGVLANIKMYGVTLQDVSAALATFGDNNIRGAKAGTDLRMAVQAMVAPVSTAGPALAQLGLKTTSLADAMKNGGLDSALELFISHLKSAGVPTKDYGELITDVFGKKAGSGIGVLIGEFSRFQGKYAQVKEGADSFASDWAARQQTMAQQWTNLKAGVSALAISFGTLLLPAATKVVGTLAKFADLLEEHPALAAFAGALLAVAVAFKVVATAEAIFDAVTVANPVMVVVMAVIALTYGLYELYTHFKIVRDIVADVGKVFADAWEVAVDAAGAVIRWFVSGPLALIKQEIGVFTQWWSQNSAQVEEVTRAVWTVIKDIVTVYWTILSTEVRVGLDALKIWWKVTWAVFADSLKYLWDIMATQVEVSIRLILDVITVVLDLLTGRWGAAWGALKKLASDALHGAVAVIMSYVGGFGTLLWDAGKAVVGGLIGGMQSVLGGVGGLLGDLFGGGGAGEAAGGAAQAGHSVAAAFASGWDDVYRDTVGEVVRAFEAVKGAITSGFDGWWKTHGEALKEVWRATWDTVKAIFIVNWDAVMAVLVPAVRAVGDILRAVWAEVTIMTRVTWEVLGSFLKLAWAAIAVVAKVAWDAVSAAVKIAWDVIAAVVKVAVDLVTAVVKTGWDVISAYVKVVLAAVEAVIKVTWDVIVGIFSVALDLLTGHWSQAWRDIQATCTQVANAVRGFLAATWAAIAAVAIQVWNNVKGFLAQTWNALWGLVVQVFNQVKNFLVQTWNAIYNGVISAWHTIFAFFASVPGQILGALGDVGSLLFSAGKAIIQGLINGVESMVGSAISTIKSVGSSLLHGAMSALGISSPSKEFYKLGAFITQGLALGISETAAQAAAAASALAAQVSAAYSAGQVTSSEAGSLQGSISTKLAADLLSLQRSGAATAAAVLGAEITARIGSGITEAMPQAEAAASSLMATIRKHLQDGDISTAEASSLFLKIQAALTSRQDKLTTAMSKLGLDMTAALLSSLANATSASAANTAVAKLVSYVQQAWAAGDITLSGASKLTSWLEADNSRLQSLATQRATVAATIKAADAYSGATEANTESWAGLGNITSSMTSGGMVYSGNILAGMQADLSSINAFTAAIRKLGQLGLSKNLLNQIIQMGPQQGLQVAQSLINGPLSVIQSMNTTQAQINAGADSLGQSAANAMYDSGAAAGQGFLSGLAAQQKSITAMMDQIAESMVGTIKKDLKISSPSLVMDEHGQMVAAGLIQGMERGVPGVRGAARMLAGATALPAVSSAGAGGATGGDNLTIHMAVTVNGFVGDNQQLATEIYDVFQEKTLQYRRRNGHNGLDQRA